MALVGFYLVMEVAAIVNGRQAKIRVMAESRITPRAQDFAAWYQDVVLQGDMAEPAEIVKGCMVIKPNGYAVWEALQRAFTPIEDICLKKEEQALFDKKRKYHPRRLYSLKVDARKKGNFTRFINHSEKPNVVAHLFAIPANVYGLKPASIEVVYIAKKNIYPGEQLLVCYEDGEKSYWGVSKIKPFYMTPKTFQLSSSLKIVASSSSPPK